VEIVIERDILVFLFVCSEFDFTSAFMGVVLRILIFLFSSIVCSEFKSRCVYEKLS
jgi:hypothetical protein